MLTDLLDMLVAPRREAASITALKQSEQLNIFVEIESVQNM